MKTLDHPLKRLSFVLFLLGAASFFALALLPMPLTLSSHDDWRDAVGSESSDRQITRIDTSCAARAFGSVESFAKEYFIVEAHSSENKYTRFMTLDTIERGERFTIAKKVDLSDKERASFISNLSNPRRPCLKNACVEKLTPPLFAEIVSSCGESIKQHRHVVHSVDWHIGENLEEQAPWPTVLLCMGLVFLLTSVLYNRVTRPLVNWVRTGLW